MEQQEVTVVDRLGVQAQPHRPGGRERDGADVQSQRTVAGEPQPHPGRRGPGQPGQQRPGGRGVERQAEPLRRARQPA